MASVGRGNGARVFSGLVIALALAPAALAQSDPSAQTATLPASVTGVWTLSGEDRFGRFEGEVLFGDVGRDGRVTFSGTRVYADGTTRSLSGEGSSPATG